MPKGETNRRGRVQRSSRDSCASSNGQTDASLQLRKPLRFFAVPGPNATPTPWLLFRHLIRLKTNNGVSLFRLTNSTAFSWAPANGTSHHVTILRRFCSPEKFARTAANQ